MPILFLVAYLWYNERTILRRCRKEAFIESCAAIVILKECTWYNERIILRRCRKEAFIESCAAIVIKKVYGIIFEILAGKSCV